MKPKSWAREARAVAGADLTWKHMEVILTKLIQREMEWDASETLCTNLQHRGNVLCSTEVAWKWVATCSIEGKCKSMQCNGCSVTAVKDVRRAHLAWKNVGGNCMEGDRQARAVAARTLREVAYVKGCYCGRGGAQT